MKGNFINRESFIVIVFVLFFSMWLSCKHAADRSGEDKQITNFKATDLIEEDRFTSGIEGPAVDRNGNLYAVNFSHQGTIGVIPEVGDSDIYIQLPEGSIGNGIRFNSNGDMLIADYTGHNILKVKMRTNEIITFAHGEDMNQPNDIAINRQDVIFASDPNWANSTGKLWRISPDGTITLLEDSMGTTNGIEVSVEEKKLYVNESIQRRIWVYEITEEGDISNKKLFKSFKDFGLDGMRCDSKGNLFITRHGKGTVLMVSPEGEEIMEIELKGEKPTNITFGGSDGKTCYVTIADRGCIETFQVPYPGRSFLLHKD